MENAVKKLNYSKGELTSEKKYQKHSKYNSLSIRFKIVGISSQQRTLVEIPRTKWGLKSYPLVDHSPFSPTSTHTCVSNNTCVFHHYTDVFLKLISNNVSWINHLRKAVITFVVSLYVECLNSSCEIN